MKRFVWLCFLFFPLPNQSAAADISTFSFAGCAFSDTNQAGSYTATFGEDHDYSSTVSTMSFTVYNPVGISSVTVDNRTGLMWVTNPRTDAVFIGTQTWESALTSCTVTLNGIAYAGYTDWRLPNVQELLSIVNFGVESPSIDIAAFPGTVPKGYWTSTTANAAANAWLVDFSNGSISGWGKSPGGQYVRCVRGGP